MPRGSKPGERRGGRKLGTPNKKTALKNAAFLAAAASLDSTPLDFMLRLMRDPNVPMDLRIDMAVAAVPYVNSRPRKHRPAALDLTTRIQATVITTEVETKLKSTRLLASDTDGSTPLAFLVGVMSDAEATPRQRIKAARTAARYKHIPGQTDTFKSIVRDPFGFSCDIDIAREIRHCRLRQRRMTLGFRYGQMPRPYTSSDTEEGCIIRSRLTELKARLRPCRAYQKEDRDSDLRRVNELAQKRNRGDLTPEEDTEDAYLWARMESYIETPEEEASRIYRELRTRRSHQDKFTAAEEAKFEDIERRYPLLNPYKELEQRSEPRWRPYSHLRIPTDQEIDAFYREDDFRKNIASGKPPWVAAKAARDAAKERFYADQERIESNKKSMQDKRAAETEDKDLVPKQEEQASMEESAAPLRDKADQQTVAKNDENLGERGRTSAPVVDFQEFLD
jgi:hypothetical protein